MAGLGDALEALESEIQLAHSVPLQRFAELALQEAARKPSGAPAPEAAPAPTAAQNPLASEEEGVVRLPGVSPALLSLIDLAAGAGPFGVGPGAGAAPEEGWEALRRLRLLVAGLAGAPESAVDAGQGAHGSTARGHGSSSREAGSEDLDLAQGVMGQASASACRLAHRVMDTIFAIMGGLPESGVEMEATEEHSGSALPERTAPGAADSNETKREQGMQVPIGEVRTQREAGSPQVMLTPDAAKLAARLLPWLPCSGPGEDTALAMEDGAHASASTSCRTQPLDPRSRTAEALLAVLRSCTRNRSMCSSVGVLGELLVALRIILLGGVRPDGSLPDACFHKGAHGSIPPEEAPLFAGVPGASLPLAHSRLRTGNEEHRNGETHAREVGEDGAAHVAGLGSLHGTQAEKRWARDMLKEAIVCLGSHSASLQEVRLWVATAERASSVGQGQEVLSLMVRALSGPETRGPTHSFELDGQSSGLLGPAEMKWPFSNGYAFVTWLYVESFHNSEGGAMAAAAMAAAIAASASARVGKASPMSAAAAASALAGEGLVHMPRLFSFLTPAESYGVEAYFHSGFLIVESSEGHKGGGGLKRSAFHFNFSFQPQRWFCVGLEHAFKPSLLGKGESEMRLYVDGRLVEMRPLDLPRALSNRPLGFLCVGTNPPAAMAGLQRRRKQCPLFAELGPVYIFKEPIGSERMFRLAQRGADYLPSFGAGAGVPALLTSTPLLLSAEECYGLDTELGPRLHLLYHPRLLAGRFCPDASPVGASGGCACCFWLMRFCTSLSSSQDNSSNREEEPAFLLLAQEGVQKSFCHAVQEPIGDRRRFWVKCTLQPGRVSCVASGPWLLEDPWHCCHWPLQLWSFLTVLLQLSSQARTVPLLCPRTPQPCCRSSCSSWPTPWRTLWDRWTRRS